MATAPPAAQAINLSILAGLGVIGDANNAPVDYNPLTLTASYIQTVTVTVPHGTANKDINLATLFPTIVAPQLVAVQEVSSNSAAGAVAWTAGVLQWSWANSGQKAGFPPGSVWLSMLDPGNVTPMPHIFVDNADATNDAILNITVIGS